MELETQPLKYLQLTENISIECKTASIVTIKSQNIHYNYLWRNIKPKRCELRIATITKLTFLCLQEHNLKKSGFKDLKTCRHIANC